MQTLILPPKPENLLRAARIIQEGGIAAFPTETVYGLGANALEKQAVKRIFVAKGRPADNPLIVHLWDVSQISSVAESLPDYAGKLAAAFMPGPLTLVLKKKACIPDVVTAGLDSVAVRIPSHPVALELLKLCGCPVAAPSANTSSRPSPTDAHAVFEDMDGRIPLIIDGGPCDVGIESTVVSALGELPAVLRPGKVTADEIAAVCGGISMDIPADRERPLSPGTKYRHYSPSCLTLGFFEVTDRLKEQLRRFAEQGKRISVVAFESALVKFEGVRKFSLGENETEAAERLFAHLRAAEKGADVIFVQSPPRKAMGGALYNRISKACGEQFAD